MVHKEESLVRIPSEQIDRIKIRSFLSSCIHPLDLDSHDPVVLCNIWTGEASDEKTNVHQSVEIEQRQMETFPDESSRRFQEQDLKHDFHDEKEKIREERNSRIAQF